LSFEQSIASIISIILSSLSSVLLLSLAMGGYFVFVGYKDVFCS